MLNTVKVCSLNNLHYLRALFILFDKNKFLLKFSTFLFVSVIILGFQFFIYCVSLKIMMIKY